MKTVQEWFQELPEPYRTQALNNSLKGNLMAEVDSLEMALGCRFSFRGSKEGKEYWRLFMLETFYKKPEQNQN